MDYLEYFVRQEVWRKNKCYSSRHSKTTFLADISVTSVAKTEIILFGHNHLFIWQAYQSK